MLSAPCPPAQQAAPEPGVPQRSGAGRGHRGRQDPLGELPWPCCGEEPLREAACPNSPQGRGQEGRKMLLVLRTLSSVFQI